MENSTFEEQLKRLEEIVASLEQGNLPLEETFKLVEEGQKLSSLLLKQIEEAENKLSSYKVASEANPEGE